MALMRTARSASTPQPQPVPKHPFLNVLSHAGSVGLELACPLSRRDRPHLGHSMRELLNLASHAGQVTVATTASSLCLSAGTLAYIDRRSDRLLHPPPHLLRLLRHGVGPPTVGPIGVDGVDPPLRGLRLHIGQRVEALRFEDEVHGRVGLQPDDEVGNVVVGFAVVEVGDAEAETLVLDEGFHEVVRVEVVRGRLLPLLRVGDDVVQMALHHLPHVLARPEVHLFRRARAAV